MAESMDGSQATVNTNNCAHLDSVIDDVKDNYHIILAYYVTSIAEKALDKKADEVYCHAPHCKTTHKRVHACLECAFFGCFEVSEGSGSHMKDHALKHDHNFAINIEHGSLFCFKCDDYIYNETFENMVIEYKLEARRINGYRSYLPWTPDRMEVKLLKDKIKPISEGERLGVRGIVNIGYSCYFNSVIHTFLHNPVLRCFILSDKHSCSEKDCLLCAMFAMFQEFYSGVTLPYVPLNFFHVLQKFCQHDIGKAEQDAYELYTEVITGLKSSCGEIPTKNNCNRVIDEIFYGIIKKTKTCTCGYSSDFADEHFLSILLDKGEDKTLEEILKRKFLSQELLQGYRCPECEESNTTSYKEAIKKLPAVICFRMNCFGFIEDKKKKMKAIKKNTDIEFKDFIDMSAYLNLECSTTMSNGSLASENFDSVNRYSLFGVLFHVGTVQNGHYKVSIKHYCKWYECNDYLVYNRSWSEVINPEPYLLYYCKQ